LDPTRSQFIAKFYESAKDAKSKLQALKYWTDPALGKANRE